MTPSVSTPGPVAANGTATIAWTFPQPFPGATPEILFSNWAFVGPNGHNFTGTRSVISGTGMSVFVLNRFATSLATSISALALGRWK